MKTYVDGNVLLEEILEMLKIRTKMEIMLLENYGC